MWEGYREAREENNRGGRSTKKVKEGNRKCVGGVERGEGEEQ